MNAKKMRQHRRIILQLLSGKELDDEEEKVGLKKCIEVLDFCETCLRVYRARTSEK